MKKFKSTISVLILGLTLLVGNAFGTDATNHTINRIGSWGNGNFFFRTVEGESAEFYFSINSDAGRSLLAVILTAYSQGKAISFVHNTNVVSQVWTE